MALSKVCEKGHHYVQPDIVVGERPPEMPACPTCAEEWLAERQIKDIQRVKLEPGDVLVVRYEGPMSVEMASRIRNKLGRVFPDNDVLVFDRNPTLSVIEVGK